MSLNILTNELPKKLLSHEINWDYRSCLKIILAFEDPVLTHNEKIYVMLKRIFGFMPKENIEEYVKQAIWFLNCGEENEVKKESERLYSFEKDAKYIYVAMKQSMSINWESLHWWDFVNYFMALDEKSFFSRMLYLRSQHAKGKLTKEEAKYWAEHEDILVLNQQEESDAVKQFKKLMKSGG